MIYIITMICVIGIAIGQIMFKMSSSALSRTGSLFSYETLILLIPALSLYGITTLAWIWVLQKIELGKAYPFMALAFILVPIGSHFFLGERFNTSYFVGVLLIMIGIIVTIRATS
ncbi:EamA family transporter [Enterobacteriaceae bacterium RIT714]|nr:EamA family transporter [Enterobacteriaceae bacterium RIT714]